MPRAESTALHRSFLPQFCVLLAMVLNLSLAWAHEGHEEEAETAVAASAELPRLVHSSPRLEAVALIDAQGLAIWVDDYASNRPLQGLDVSVRLGSAALQAKETEPGLYRLPLDLLGDGPVRLAISLRGSADGAAFEESLKGELPIPHADEERPQGELIVWAGGALLLLGLVAATALGFRARRRRAALSGV